MTWLRWSLRDFRAYWAAVVAIALVLSIGLGVYAGLGSTSQWRRASNDASFDEYRMYDLRVEMSPGTFADESTLTAVLDGLPDGLVEHASERLVVSSQIGTSNGKEDILSAARLVGMDTAADAPVARLWVRDGTAPDSDTSDAVLEVKYADYWELPENGTFLAAGGTEVTYRGIGAIAEDFYYEGPEGSLIAEGELAPFYMPLAAAQELVARPGQVNDLVLTVAADADVDDVATLLSDELEELELGAVVTDRTDSYAYRTLYEDIDSDQKVYNAVATLILAAAAVAAFNLITRIVEAQRREIGIGMAIGSPRWKLAIRPMLVGLQVAILALIGGVLVGRLIAGAMGAVLESFLPLPVWLTGFEPAVFARAAALAVGIPLLAAAIPVWRAVSVEPIQAIRTGHLTAKSSRFTELTGRVPMPGSSLTQMPLRNLLRTPRRTFLTAVGVGAAVAALVGVIGMMDSFSNTVDRAADELQHDEPDRILVQLDTFRPESSDTVAAVENATSVGRVDTGLRLPVTVNPPDGGEEFTLVIEMIDVESAAWTPTIDPGDAEVSDGVVLAAKAADDLGVVVGDTLDWIYPVRTDSGSFTLQESDVRVTAIHPNPLRTFAFMDASAATRFGLAGATNLLSVYPSDGSTTADVQRDLFDLDGVASSQSVARITESIDEALDSFAAILAVVAVAVTVLALLIAFNSTRITVDERRREHATMRAFGLPVRSIVGTVVKESVVVGIVATIIGVALGALLVRRFLAISASTLPDVLLEPSVSPRTLLIAGIVGVVAMAVTPLVLARRISRMNIPDTLRVME